MLKGLQQGCPGNEVDNLNLDNKIYLPSLHKNPTILHLLLLNANGDIYQIAQRFGQENMPPMTADDDFLKLSCVHGMTD